MEQQKKGWDTFSVSWDKILSLGEQQRMGMARVLFHKPKFCVLDECTDAVSVDVEEKMFAHLKNEKICCITISKRLVLEDFHTQHLELGLQTRGGAPGWRMKRL